ncbi:MAG: translation initiation factor IF-5A [Candidatus Micrarchaeia archaeon]
MSEEILYVSMKEIKPGRFILIDGIPCKVVDVETSAPGKHGSAKMRVTAIGIFDGQKKTLLKPSSGDVEVPVINKKKAQVVSVTESTAQLMDLQTYETYEVPIPDDLKGSIKSGSEVEVIESMNRYAISRVLG